MGLDITVYKNLQKVEDSEGMDPEYPDDREPKDGYTKFYVNPDFPGRANEIDGDAFYAVAEVDGFRAGSYSGYNMWRKWLAGLAGYEPQQLWDKPSLIKSLPFAELVNFSDCEGVLGAAVCKKLAGDFAKFQPEADASKKQEISGEYYHGLYEKWRAAFEVAGDNNGAVAFH